MNDITLEMQEALSGLRKQVGVKIVSVNHAAVTSLAMGGEVAMHRQMKALVDGGHDVTVLAERGVSAPHVYEGVKIEALTEIGHQLMELKPDVVFGFHEQAVQASIAATAQGILSVTRMDAPPKYGHHLLNAVVTSDAVIYNTHVAAREWGEPDALVIHPPMPEGPTVVRKADVGDPYLVTSNLRNKGIEIVLELARRRPYQLFWVIRSPAQPTHGLPDFDQRVAKLPNVRVFERVAPHEMPDLYDRCRMVLVPSRYETYGMAGLEGLAHGKPCVHVDTPHAFEGVGPEFCVPSTIEHVAGRISYIEQDYDRWVDAALMRTAEVQERQKEELSYLAEWITRLRPVDAVLKAQRRQKIRRRVGVHR